MSAGAHPGGRTELKFSTRRVIAPLAALAVVGVALSGCSSGTTGPAGSVGKADGIVTISGPITDTDAALLEQSWAGWEKTNHITIKYTGSKNFEEQIGGAAQQGNAPDLAIFAQPGLVKDLATRGYLQKLPSPVTANVKANFPAQWAGYTTTGGANYAAPLLASINGWVFYSPAQFAKWGVSVPKTWSDLYLLTQTIQSKSGSAPWCEGFSANAASGASGTNWVEDLVLRQEGPAVYDQWVTHKIPFSDPRIKRAFDDAAEILLDKNYTNAGIGGVNTVDTATTADVARAMLSGKCALAHQDSSFVGDLANADTTGGTLSNVSPEGNYWAFPLPPFTDTSIPVTGGGDFVAAFSNDSDTVKVQKYLSSTAWAISRVKLGGVVSPDPGVPLNDPTSPLLQLSAATLQDQRTVFRFDASALMPSVVGSGSFLTGMVDWVNGTSTTKVLSSIDAAWPSH
ncbi:MAG: sugar transporter substrate-binding protein [Glaciihabitans sp.]|nr:sugar transporter substrate-binding protein [Glaciihabitans sp.]